MIKLLDEKYACIQWVTTPIRVYRLYLHLLAVFASPIHEIPRNSPKIRNYSSSRSSKVIDLGVNRKCIFDFLLVRKSNYRKWFVLPTPPIFDVPARGRTH